MGTTHPTAAAGFGSAAAAYERGRPSYPADAVAHLVAELGIAGGTVLDLAAGTGKLTRLLTGPAARMIAVEPVAGMRERLAGVVGVEVLDGTAEAIPVPAGSVDAVTVAQAFHWFDAEAAVAEIHRVLRPGGGLGLIWNTFDSSVDWIAALQSLVHAHQRGEPGYSWSGWRQVFRNSELFTPLEERAFAIVQELDTDGLVDRVCSTSYIAALPEPVRAELVAQVRALVADVPPPLRLPYRTDTYCAHAR